MQAQLVQRDLSRRTADGCIEPLFLEDGKAAVLNVHGSFALQRHHFANLSMKDYASLWRVRCFSLPPMDPHTMLDNTGPQHCT